jgi:hypothetical protein
VVRGKGATVKTKEGLKKKKEEEEEEGRDTESESPDA